MKVSAIIPAAGSGQRFGEVKQFKLLAGRPLLFHTLKPFLQSNYIDEVIVVVVPLIVTLIVIVVELGFSLLCQCSSQIRKSPLQLTHHCTCTECENTCPTL